MAPPLRRAHPYLPRNPPAQEQQPSRSTTAQPHPPPAPSQVQRLAQPIRPAQFHPPTQQHHPWMTHPQRPACSLPPSMFQPLACSLPPPQPPVAVMFQPSMQYRPPPHPLPLEPPRSDEDDDIAYEGEFHLSEEDDSDSDDFEFNEKTPIVLRGTGYPGFEEYSFDKTCIFGNVVALNFQQITFLRSIAEELPRPPTKEYICTLSKSNVLTGECSLEFTPEYTSTYLLQFLMDPNALRLGTVARPKIISVAVWTTTSTVKKYCNMKLQACGKAIVYNEAWAEVVNAFNLQEGDVCMFRFKDDRVIPKIHRDPAAWLTMEIVKLGEEA